MMPGLDRPLPLKTRLFLLFSSAPLVWLLFGLGSLLVEHRASNSPNLDALAGELQSAFNRLLEHASTIAQTALDGSPWRAAELARRGPLGSRLEGVGIFDSQGSYLEWRGRPVEPTGYLSDPGSPTWTIRLDGIRTRLVARAGPNDFGFFALATFVLDSTLGDVTFGQSMDRRLPASSLLRVEFLDTSALYGDALSDPALRQDITLRERDALEESSTFISSPLNEILARACIAVVPAARRAKQLRRVGESWAALALALSLLLCFRWGKASRTVPGLLGVGLALALGRAALLVFDFPARLLPRELGSPSVYGSSGLWGLLGSPSDLLLSCLGLYIGCRAVRTYAGALAGRRPRTAVALAVGTALVATAILYGLTVSLAQNSRVPLLQMESLFPMGGLALLIVGWVLAMLAAAELWASSWICLRSSDEQPHGRPERASVALALLPLALLASTTLETLDDRLALQRLRSEFAPQVLEQSSHRRVALLSAIRHAAESLQEPGSSATEESSQPEFLAFSLWVSSDLFHTGYKSSLDLYSVNGTLVSHFGFDLPALTEEIPAADSLPAVPVISEEEFSVGALSQRLLHAEMPVWRDGIVLGVVVGHVLEEPSNLPFLPSSEPYLAALGPGGPYPRRKNGLVLPQYVLYDRRGTVLLRTLDQPPTLTREMEIAATQKRTVKLVAGEDSYAGLPLLDGDRLHLLLLRSRTLLERLGTFVRLSLLALGLLLGSFLLASVFRPGGLSQLSRAVRSSFYRKLLATLLLASVLPLVGLSLFVRGYIESRGAVALVSAAVQYVSVAQRVVEDFLVTQYIDQEEGSPGLNDEILYWLRRLVEQEIHVYREGRLEASSKRELFASGLLPSRLPGEVQDRMVRGGLPYLVLEMQLGDAKIPVAYAPLRAPGIPTGLVVAVPLILQEQEIARTVDRVAETLLLATVLLAGMLALAAAVLARTVARPVRELVGATGRIATGDYGARLKARTQDEVAELVEGFNIMASALAAQRADLEQRRDYIEALLRNATTGVASTDAEGRIVTVNPAMTTLLGLAPSSLQPGENLAEAVSRHRELKPLGEKLALPARRLAEPREVDLQREGQARRFRVVRVDLPDPWGRAPGSLILMDDVTDLMRSNQLAAWAEMARAIAHEIKNPLTPIQLSTEHLQRVLRDRKVLPSPEIESCLETVIKQVRALQEIAAEFSAYAKLPSLAPEPGDAVAFMREVVGPYRAGKPRGITIEERYRPSPPVSIDRRVLGRAVVNLVENALQAMPEGGKLTVSVAPDDDNGEVVLTVEDTGSGLSPEVKARLFEPYFSTKSSGTGLGLAIVRRAIEAHQGKIEVASETGRGTAIHIRLPAIETA